VPIIAVILMLFSRPARVNGPVFLLGWELALGVVSASEQVPCLRQSTCGASPRP
jgi:hypothetical protein